MDQNGDERRHGRRTADQNAPAFQLPNAPAEEHNIQRIGQNRHRYAHCAGGRQGGAPAVAKESRAGGADHKSQRKCHGDDQQPVHQGETYRTRDMKPEGLDDRDQDRGQTKAPKSSWSPQHPPHVAHRLLR